MYQPDSGQRSYKPQTKQEATNPKPNKKLQTPNQAYRENDTA